MDKNWIMQLQRQTQLTKVIETNQTTKQYGLSLTEEEAKLIVTERVNTLKVQKRVEFGEGITPKIIFEFCDSAGALRLK